MKRLPIPGMEYQNVHSNDAMFKTLANIQCRSRSKIAAVAKILKCPNIRIHNLVICATLIWQVGFAKCWKELIPLFVTTPAQKTMKISVSFAEYFLKISFHINPSLYCRLMPC
jgi:hypothetical protein